MADADEHANAGRYADALRVYAEAFEAMPDSLQVSGVAEFAVLAAGQAAIADYQERGEVPVLERGRAVLAQFIEGVSAEPNAEVSADAAQTLLAEIDALVPEGESDVVEPKAKVERLPEPDPEPASAPVEEEEPGKLCRMGKAGVALMALGGLTAVGGTVLVAREPTGFPVGHPNADKLETTRPAGGGVLGGGLALVVVGAVLLGVDRKRAKQRKASAARSSTSPKVEAAVHPWLGGHGGGLGVTGRF
ncbi:MAG: hypothetical protein AAGF11_54995 [Myxococcota bacterium]